MSQVVCAVVVAFHPEPDIIKSVISETAPQVETVIVVDNANQLELRDLSEELGVLYTSFASNKGLAFAQNYGISMALGKGATHVLLMDQDSVPRNNMVSTMLDIEQELRQRGTQKVGAIGARYVGRHAENESFFVRFGWFKFHRVFCSGTDQRFVQADFLISSGTLITKEALEKVGMMDDELFIDHIDTDWFLRANHEGYYSYGACDAAMEHSLGESTVRVWLGRWRYLPKHKSFRYYYMFRNSLLIYRKTYAPIKWIINDIVRLGFILIFYSLFVEPRAQRLKMIGKGIVDGLSSRKGNHMAVSTNG